MEVLAWDRHNNMVGLNWLIGSQPSTSVHYPIYSPLYAASEGLLGVNIWPQDKPSKYMLVPGYMFFEFIPVENCEEHQPKVYPYSKYLVIC
jgi:hypothetical protein